MIFGHRCNKPKNEGYKMEKHQIEKIAAELTVIMNNIEMQQHVINLMPVQTRTSDDILSYHYADKAHSTFFDVNDKMIKDLDEIIFQLMNEWKVEEDGMPDTEASNLQEQEGD